MLGAGNTLEWDLNSVTTATYSGISAGGGYGGLIQGIGSVGVVDLTTGAIINNSIAATATGVPLLAGILVPEDFVVGNRITHALAMAWPQFRNQNLYSDNNLNEFNPPCSANIVFGASWRQYALAPGQRLRLAAKLQYINGTEINERVFSKAARMVLAALRNYGAIAVRVGASMMLLQEDETTGFLNVTAEEFKDLTGADLIPSLSPWTQLTRRLTQELLSIPLGVPQSTSPPHVLNRELVREPELTHVNWEVVSGTIGPYQVGEPFIQNYDYVSSIDIVLIILAFIIFLPSAILVGYFLMN